MGNVEVFPSFREFYLLLSLEEHSQNVMVRNQCDYKVIKKR